MIGEPWQAQASNSISQGQAGVRRWSPKKDMDEKARERVVRRERERESATYTAETGIAI